jgi:hypothetical protein
MSETPNIYDAGNTIRLQCIFEDFDGNRVDPTTVKIIIYDHRYRMLEQAILGSGNRIDLGTYFYNYTSPKDDEERIIYEWSGEIDGFVSLKRATFSTILI